MKTELKQTGGGTRWPPGPQIKIKRPRFGPEQIINGSELGWE